MSIRRANIRSLLQVPSLVPSATVVQRHLASVMASPRFAASWLAAMLGRTELPGRDELAALRPATRVLIVGLAAWILLVGMVTFIAVASVEVSTMNLPAWLDPRGSASPATQARARAAFDNIVQRPLFSRVRQVPVAAPVALPPPPLPSPTVALDRKITLKGVLIGGAHAKAFLVSTQNPLGVWVQAGDDIAGWKVVALKPEEVILEGQNEKFAVPLVIRGPVK